MTAATATTRRAKKAPGNAAPVKVEPTLAAVPIVESADQVYVYDPVTHTEARFITVTPELAREWLDRHNAVNRNQRPRVIGGYTEDMREDRWKFTGDTVKFGADGLLYDGQHRLESICRSGKAQRLLVVRGLLPDARPGIDGGANRKVGDDLRIGNTDMRNIDCVVAIAGKAVAWTVLDSRLTNYGTRAVTRLEKIGFIYEHPELEYAARRGIEIYRALGKTIPPSVIGFVFWLCCQVDEEQAHTFFERLEVGVDGVANPRSPIKALDRRTRDGKGLREADWLYLVLKAWVLWRSDRPTERLALPRDRHAGKPMKPNMIPDPALILPPLSPSKAGRPVDSGVMELTEDELE